MFQDREEAGKLLADKLQKYQKNKDAVVLAIPRGGVLVGKEISHKLSIPLSLVVVKKLGAPGNSELAIGAVTQGGIKYIDWDLIQRARIEQEYLDEEITLKKREVEEREKKFLKRSNLRGGSTSLKDKKLIIITDDGIATGATILAAIKYINNIKPPTTNHQPITILAVPVIAKDTFNKLKSEVDKIVALEMPDTFNAVGQFYKDFPQISDEEVIKHLKSLK